MIWATDRAGFGTHLAWSAWPRVGPQPVGSQPMESQPGAAQTGAAQTGVARLAPVGAAAGHARINAPD